MTTLVVRARFPLGTFLGHRDSARVAEFPDTARLHAALLHSAGKGSLAIEDDGRLRPSPAAFDALRWLEGHPPSGVTHPAHRRVSRRSAGSYRSEGTVPKEGGRVIGDKKVLKAQSDAVAVVGSFEWGWVDAPGSVTSVVRALCADVSCLGESDSPVVLTAETTDDWSPSLSLDADQSAYPRPGGVVIRTPIDGRADELEAAYRTANPMKSPSQSRDRHRVAEKSRPTACPADKVMDFTYRAVQAPSPLPWSHVLVLEIGGGPKAIASAIGSPVQASVALHRALAARLGAGAPQVITGAYPRGVRRPANRLAIHVLGPDAPTAEPLDGPAFAILIPRGIDAGDLAALARVTADLTEVRVRRDQILQVRAHPELTAADTFWAGPAVGSRRFWTPRPSIVSELRPPRGKAAASWSLAESAAASAAFVFREQLSAGWSGSDRYRAAARDAQAQGFRAYDVRPIPDSRTSAHTHKMVEGVPVQPYTGWFDLGSLAPETAIVALGQSRHLGGGLLHPFDVVIDDVSDGEMA